MKELAKQYDPSQVEDRIYQFWLAAENEALWRFLCLKKRIHQFYLIPDNPEFVLEFFICAVQFIDKIHGYIAPSCLILVVVAL